MKRSSLPSLIKAVVFLIISIALTATAPAADSDGKTVAQIAVMPFTVHSDKDLSYIQRGISQMLSSRLSWKDEIVVVPESAILPFLNQKAELPQKNSEALIKKIAESTRADHVITGSITEFGGSFSLDTQVHHQGEGTTDIHTFFRQVKDQDQIMTAMNAIAAAINQQVFHRDVLWKNPADEPRAKSSEETARANPETLIRQIIPPAQPEKKPFWMFWESDPPPLYPDEIPGDKTSQDPSSAGSLNDYSGMMEEDDMEAEPVPFWKFWKKGKPKNEEDADLEYDYEDKEDVPWESTEEEPDDEKPFWKIW